MDGKKNNFIGLDDGSVGYRELVKGTDYFRDVPVISFEGGDIKILTKRGKPVETVVQAANVIGFKGKSLTTDYDAVVKAEKIACVVERQLDGEVVPMQEIKNIEVNNDPGFLSGEMKETALDLSLYKKNIADAEAVVNRTTDVIPVDLSETNKELLRQLEENRKVIDSLNEDLAKEIDNSVVNKRVENELLREERLKKQFLEENKKFKIEVDKLTNILRDQLARREDAMTLKEKIYEKAKNGLTIGALLSIIGLFIADLATKISAATGGNNSSNKGQGESGSKDKGGSGDGDSPIIAAAKTILKNVGKFVAWLLKLIGKAFAFIGKYSILFIFFAVTAILGYIISRNKK